MRRIPVIDSHTGGEPTRVVLDSVPPEELPHLRRALIDEPRGHPVIVGALLSPPATPGSVASVTFFNNAGLLGMCGHGMIGVIATLHHLGRLHPGSHRLDTPVGPVTATLHPDLSVTLENVPSYRRAKAVTADGVTGDIAWGGNWFFLVPADQHRLPLTPENLPALTAASLTLRRAINAAGFPEVDHIELLGPPADPANHGRSFVLCPGGEFDRSPCGTGTSAKLACLAADGHLPPGTDWRQESIIGSVFTASYQPGPQGTILPRITGRAHLTAETTLLLDPSDPFTLGLPLPAAYATP